jgi:hypothetical protein
MSRRLLLALALGGLVQAAAATAAPIGFTSRTAWVTALGGAPDYFVFFDETAAGANTASENDSVGTNTSPKFYVDFYATKRIDFDPFTLNGTFPTLERNRQADMTNEVGQVDGAFTARSRDTLLSNVELGIAPANNPTQQGLRAIRWDFLDPMRAVGFYVNIGDTARLELYDASDALILSQNAASGGFAGILSDVAVDHVVVVNTGDNDLRFGIYDLQYDLFVALPAPGLGALALAALLIWRGSRGARRARP